MGREVTEPEWKWDSETTEESPPLGTLLSGRFSTLDSDPVEAVHDDR